MASATLTLIVNATAIDFDSIAAMSDAGMRYVFNKIEESGLRGFFDISSQAFLVPNLLNSFENSYVEDGKVVLNVDGHIGLIDEDYFANLFNLPREGISSFGDVSSSDIEDIQALVSASSKPFKISDTKTNMKFEY